MGSEDVLVEIHPRELRFLVEVKKQSSCCIHLVNKSDQYVAFKVKTTSPKKYCVRPNIGVILPLASRDFTECNNWCFAMMKLNSLEIKLEEAITLIVKLREANTTTIQERDKLRKEMGSI
ncbi:unnamed protein product [Miscanthus lutarioriparius]|uniref:MSP domain-containing protein n=1 Tax=Miscanthus lutarioriparius TaxID=422564 RepID=A0A811RQS6_9POAL|nr:unnamed protein product [Miscanthus lutarioriparius]